MNKIRLKNSQKILKIDSRKLKSLAQKTLKSEGIDLVEVGILIVDNVQIQIFNNQYLNKACPTDVLAFRMHDGEFGDLNEQLLGDVIVSAEMACECAKKFKNDVDYELALYLVHGMLHLAGYTDKTKSGFKEMAKKQKEILKNYA